MGKSFDITSYESRISALFQRFRSVQTAGFTADSYKPGLEGMQRLDAILEHPWEAYTCIHVAGTNGKGSVCSMLAAALSAGGGVWRQTAGQCPDQAPLVGRGRALCPARMACSENPAPGSSTTGKAMVGLYTSPHLLDFRERMKIVSDDGFEMITREEVWEFLERYDSALEGLSFFEITTGMAFWWFGRRGVDAAVIETGLGGRLDSTNIITPAVSVVTSIGLDHCALLGSTRAAIAREKAGIFKNGVPAVVGVRDPETAPVFEEVAASVGAPLVFAPDVPSFIFGTDSGDNLSGKPHSEAGLLAEMDLTGPCQDQNLHTALVALSLSGYGLQTQKLPSGCLPGNFSLYRQENSRPLVYAIAESGKRTGLWGRWQKVSTAPEVICDIGHNPPALKENFARLEAMQADGRNIVMVYGIMADKDLDGIAPLIPAGIRIIATAPAGERSLPAPVLAERLTALRPDLDICLPETPGTSVQAAVRAALTLARDLPKPLVYIGGSTFVVAEALPMFNEKTAK